jgi:hypothetical protein
VEFAAAAIFLLIGARSAVRSVRDMGTEESARARTLIALHEAAKAGFWLALGAFFVGYAVVREPQQFRWFVMVPIVAAGIRLIAATLLARL